MMKLTLIMAFAILLCSACVNPSEDKTSKEVVNTTANALAHSPTDSITDTLKNDTPPLPVANVKIHDISALDVKPNYPGGIKAFYKFIIENLDYPKEAFEHNINGTVLVSLTVNTEGNLTDLKVDKKLGYGTDEEAIRVIKLSKKWNPGQLNGKPVNVAMYIPVKFTM